MSITVLTPTNRASNINNIVDNFLRQNFSDKELIILVNYANFNIAKWANVISKHDNISVYNLGNKISLGNSLNIGVLKSKFDYIAKFDDDDYYSQDYLNSSFKSLINSNSDIVGKNCYYIYFQDENLIGLKYSKYENRYCQRVAGSTLFFKKEIFNRIQFKDKNLGEDKDFCTNAMKYGFKIFSSDRKHYIYIRKNKNQHTWKINNNFLIKECINLIDAPNPVNFNNMWHTD